MHGLITAEEPYRFCVVKINPDYALPSVTKCLLSRMVKPVRSHKVGAMVRRLAEPLLERTTLRSSAPYWRSNAYRAGGMASSASLRGHQPSLVTTVHQVPLREAIASAGKTPLHAT